MNILHLAKQDKGGGGGGFDSAFRLHKNLRSFGVNSFMVVQRKESDEENVITVDSSYRAADHFKRWYYEIILNLRRFYYKPVEYFKIDNSVIVSMERLIKSIPCVPDVIIAHWVTGFVTARSLYSLSTTLGVPVIWYLVDTGPLTGGCHYPVGCDGFKGKCGDCPQLALNRGSNDLSFKQWQDRYSAVQNAKVTAVPGSSWLLNRVKESSIFRGIPCEKILLGMDCAEFSPGNQNDARDKLGLPSGRDILFYGAHNINEERKGFHHFHEALDILRKMLSDDIELRDNILVVTAGNAAGLENYEIPFEHRHIGFLKGDAMLAAGFRSADIFINSAIEDAGPMMINEAILCGTPVVSFDMGVAPDLVYSGRTGYRARLGDVHDFALGMRTLLKMGKAERLAMSNECRTIAVRYCHPDVQSKSFINLIERICQHSMADGITNEHYK